MDLSGRQYSPDGRWRWDGSAWRPQPRQDRALAFLQIGAGITLAAVGEGLLVLVSSVLFDGRALYPDLVPPDISTDSVVLTVMALPVIALAYVAILAGARRMSRPAART
jgi:hypothetical protein